MKNKEYKHQELKNQDLLGSPHLEEEWIGGMLDQDLLSCFPKNWQESLEGLREIKALEVNKEGVREAPKLGKHWER